MANDIKRYEESERVNHWVVVIAFFLAALSGLALFHPALFWLSTLFGGGPWTRILHPFLGVAMFIGFISMMLRFWHHNKMTPNDKQWLTSSFDPEPESLMKTKLILPALLLLSVVQSFAQTSPAAAAAKSYRQIHEHEIMAEYVSLLSIPNVASDKANIGRNANLIAQMMERRGVKTRLLEMIALQADILELKTNSQRPAEGTVIEAKLDRGRGPVATVLVQRGTLRIGDIIVAGAEMGRVRALISDQGENLEEAGPSVPVEVLGFNGPPEAGDRLAVVENEARARQVTSYRAHQKRENAAASISGMRGSLEQMMSQLKTAGRKEFPLIVKADVQGSLEAILGSLEKLGTEEVAARILHAGVGGISESDVTLAEGFNAAIIGFSVRANKEAAAAAKRNGIEIRYYNIIYDLVDDIKKAMSGLLAPTLRETMLGNAQILEIFNISKVGKVAGCRVTDGTVERGANVRLIRDNVVVHEGKLSTLKRFKDEVKEVQSGQECGMAFENYDDIRPGDIIEIFESEEVERKLA